MINTPIQSAEQNRLRTRGEARKRDDATLALLALIGGQDLARIPLTWSRIAPRPYRGLATAIIATPATAPANTFWFDPDTNRFGFGTRGYIPATAIRNAIYNANATAAAEIATMTAATGRGEIPLPTWQDLMTQAIKDVQLANAAVGIGGVVRLGNPELVHVGQTLEYQYGRLDLFAEQLENDTGPNTPASAAARAAAYAKSALATFGGMNRRSAEKAGATLERNILGNAEHCQPDPRRPNIPDCPSLTKLGWVPIGTMPVPGERLCLWNCRCNQEFARG